MKTHRRAWLLALTTLGALGVCNAQSELNRCQQPDGGVTFQQAPCPLAEIVLPAPPSPAPPPVAAPKPEAPPVAKPAPVAASPKPPERLVVTPAPVIIPAPLAGVDPSQEDGFIKPTKRKREILDITAQFERCRADAPGFAQQSAPVYAAWTRRHSAVLAEYHKLIAAKVRAGRRGEMTLPLQLCNDGWLREIEPLSRMPDPRFQTVEKTWQVFMGALMTGDRVALMNCLAGQAESRWKERAERLSDGDMRRIGASIRGLKVQWGDDYEKEGLVADTENRVAGIAFRNINEEWKITDMGGKPPTAVPAN